MCDSNEDLFYSVTYTRAPFRNHVAHLRAWNKELALKRINDRLSTSPYILENGERCCGRAAEIDKDTYERCVQNGL